MKYITHIPIGIFHAGLYLNIEILKPEEVRSVIVHFQTVLSPIGVHIMHDWKKLQFMTTKTFVPKQFMTCIVILNKSAFGTNQQFLSLSTFSKGTPENDTSTSYYILS